MLGIVVLVFLVSFSLSTIFDISEYRVAEINKLTNNITNISKYVSIKLYIGKNFNISDYSIRISFFSKQNATLLYQNCTTNDSALYFKNKTFLFLKNYLNDSFFCFVKFNTLINISSLKKFNVTFKNYYFIGESDYFTIYSNETYVLDIVKIKNFSIDRVTGNCSKLNNTILIKKGICKVYFTILQSNYINYTNFTSEGVILDIPFYLKLYRVINDSFIISNLSISHNYLIELMKLEKKRDNNKFILNFSIKTYKNISIKKVNIDLYYLNSTNNITNFFNNNKLIFNITYGNVTINSTSILVAILNLKNKLYSLDKVKLDCRDVIYIYPKLKLVSSYFLKVYKSLEDFDKYYRIKVVIFNIGLAKTPKIKYIEVLPCDSLENVSIFYNNEKFENYSIKLVKKNDAYYYIFDLLDLKPKDNLTMFLTINKSCYNKFLLDRIYLVGIDPNLVEGNLKLNVVNNMKLLVYTNYYNDFTYIVISLFITSIVLLLLLGKREVLIIFILFYFSFSVDVYINIKGNKVVDIHVYNIKSTKYSLYPFFSKHKNISPIEFFYTFKYDNSSKKYYYYYFITNNLPNSIILKIICENLVNSNDVDIRIFGAKKIYEDFNKNYESYILVPPSSVSSLVIYNSKPVNCNLTSLKRKTRLISIINRSSTIVYLDENKIFLKSSNPNTLIIFSKDNEEFLVLNSKSSNKSIINKDLYLDFLKGRLKDFNIYYLKGMDEITIYLKAYPSLIGVSRIMVIYPKIAWNYELRYLILNTNNYKESFNILELEPNTAYVKVLNFKNLIGELKLKSYFRELNILVLPDGYSLVNPDCLVFLRCYYYKPYSICLKNVKGNCNIEVYNKTDNVIKLNRKINYDIIKKIKIVGNPFNSLIIVTNYNLYKSNLLNFLEILKSILPFVLSTFILVFSIYIYELELKK